MSDNQGNRRNEVGTSKRKNFLLEISSQKGWKRFFARWIFPFIVGAFFWLLGLFGKIGDGFDIQVFVLKILIAYVLLDIPQMILEETSKLSEKVEKEMGRVKELSQFTAYQTDDNVFGNKMDILNGQLTESSHKWIYSKYISKLLSISFRDFKIQFDEGEKGTRDYSKFSTDLMKECTNSVYLTGSMTPYEWLSSLAVNDTEKGFFNNTSENLEIDSENHATTLGALPINNKRRAVCLSEFDFNHLFLSERSIIEYYNKNKGIETTFCKWTKKLSSKYSKMNPLDYEYAWYDKSLLFKFGKRSKCLEVLIDDGQETEYKSVKTFFDDLENKKEIHFSEADLIKIVKKSKNELLTSIINNNYQIPHKYAYLLDSEWPNFLKNSRTFDFSAKVQTASLFETFHKELNISENMEVVEIGSGMGDKSLSLCERVFPDKIQSFKLIDISRPMLDDSELLLNQSPRLKGKVRIKHFDCCDSRNAPQDIYRDKTVLILNNSTIFSEEGFPWQPLQTAKRIFITLHVLEANGNEKTFNDYFKARRLFIAPLRIFGIPVTDDLVFTDKFRACFNDNGATYTNADPYYKITFNLKKYLDELDHTAKTVYEKTSDYTRGGKEEYDVKRRNLDKQEQIIVLSSLKFRKDDAKWEAKAKRYFYKELGDVSEATWDIKIKESGSFIGIWIERKP